ncbi:cytosine permease [Leucobacter luti]|uniref:purine-cytosine permease family protein n=1 Tax=Leucobacter luti TaxID=340320 RepID=UPI00104C21E4|nr:cytosine permease [Leucobacter luti]MCW2289613.1 NCS1 family nucleobase:cation symporter-1 [Leucobacter luti]QYM77208.1 cytosine permease [Leucobacter luti]TCK37785.1 NCS1 family nucleobase:cation symporter-1 [Leucobacter luti]
MTATTHSQVPTIEDKTIQPIPLDERHGKPRDLFTIWFGSNIMVLTIVTGALGTTVFGLDFWSAVGAVAIGNLLGAIFMALHSAQGPQLGVPQMVQTRGQFGSYGSLLVVIVTVLMYVGFFAANLVLGGQALSTIIPGLPVPAGIIIIGIASVVATIYGYRLIHAYTRILSVVSGLALIVAFILLMTTMGGASEAVAAGGFNWSGFMGTLSVAALWQIAYAPYVSDYSRYLPQGIGSKQAFWTSYWGCVLGATLPMILGALVGAKLLALGMNADNVVEGMGVLMEPLTVLIVGIFSLGVAATNSMNLYCGVLSTLTVVQTFRPKWTPRAGTRAVTAVIIFAVALTLALVGADNFLVYYSNFLALLLYVLVPWTAINLVDYYLLKHGQYRVSDFFRQDGGIYGRFNWVAIGCYILGALVQVPFMVTELYTGPIGAALGGVDISWIVGLLIICPVYFFAQRASERRSPLRELVDAGQ